METVYLETSVISYLTANEGRDLIVSAHQQITREWWRVAKSRFDIYTSEAVLAEITAGDSEAIIRRIEAVQELPILKINEDVRLLAREYERKPGLPRKAGADLLHIAFAVAYEIDYLVIWNCSHIANGETIRRLLKLNQDLNRATPLVLTPEELLEPLTGDIL
jgi:predicted nucleic acid-binding protein